jgi:hypothetical protein
MCVRSEHTHGRSAVEAAQWRGVFGATICTCKPAYLAVISSRFSL